ncbi:hypothetical protein C9E82_00070 [Paracoccus siganidrum]|uniref:Uncharacterized protein n=2 Tax=Paracoccus siganidrum TaxID=1276757 RepID=A0A419A833_9RHOB|nr:hypothetical protein D3P05_08455 [Paracoccus siganidrum]RMC40976.1 hypothetical protein C9E82_00070 [Paracoccus siganidrum]
MLRRGGYDFIQRIDVETARGFPSQWRAGEPGAAALMEYLGHVLRTGDCSQSIEEFARARFDYGAWLAVGATSEGQPTFAVVVLRDLGDDNFDMKGAASVLRILGGMADPMPKILTERRA